MTMLAKRIGQIRGQYFFNWICALALTLALAGCGGTVPTESATSPDSTSPSSTSPETVMELPAQVEAAVLAAAGELTQVDPSQLAIADATPQDWPDGCLGLAEADEICTAALVPGWAVTVSNGQQQWKLRTDEEGRVVRLDAS